MTEPASKSATARWFRRIVVALVLIGVPCGVLWWRWPVDIPSAVERAGGRMVWGEEPERIERIARMLMRVPAHNHAGIWLGDTSVDDDWLRRHRSGFRRLASDVDLALPRTRITDEGLTHMSGVENVKLLWLAETRITDASVPVLSALPKLEAITLVDAQITDAGLAALKQALPNCMLSRYTSEELKAMESH
jgi:hypothetical protein